MDPSGHSRHPNTNYIDWLDWLVKTQDIPSRLVGSSEFEQMLEPLPSQEGAGKSPLINCVGSGATVSSERRMRALSCQDKSSIRIALDGRLDAFTVASVKQIDVGFHRLKVAAYKRNLSIGFQ